MSGDRHHALVRLEPSGEVDESAQVRIEVETPDGAVRVFTRDAKRQWQVVEPDSTWLARDGVTLALNATRFADANWDGSIELIARIENGDPSEATTATLPLRVAPFVMSSSPQSTETVFVRAYPGRNDAMVKDLQQIVAQAGAELYVIPGDAPYPAHHIWLQDSVEFGHAWTGRPDAPVFAVPSNRNRDLDRFAEVRLKDAGVGVLTVGRYRPAFAVGEGGDSWIDWYGNLEAAPPTPGHPFGRIIYGRNPDTGAQLNPEVVAFLAAQGVQNPVAFDVGWLQIKHVDELISFLPADDAEWPYRLVVPDPKLAIDLLKGLVTQGHGDAAMLTTYEEDATVASLLAEQEMIAFNIELREKRLEPAYAQLCTQLNIAPKHIVRLPVLFKPDGSARTPNVVNALVVNGHVVISDPDGPELADGDPFQILVRRTLADLPVKIYFVDDQLYHRWSGNVHCVTNAQREPLDVDFAE